MLHLIFKPESEVFNSASKEYEDIWTNENEKILKAFENITGITFEQKEIKVVVYEGVSISGSLVSPMKMRASYSIDEKKGTLIHELGHRLIASMHQRIENIDEHQTLNLFLYDVWESLYGKDFADKMVEIESKRKGIYNYKNAWDWALNMNKEERNLLCRRLKI